MPRTKTKSEFVSSAGTVFELVKALADEVNSLGGNDDHLRRILSDKSVVREVAELLVGKPVPESYSLTINRQRSRSEMVAAGNYDYANPNITEENFPVGEGEAEVKAVLLHLDRDASDEEVLAEMERQGLRPATMDELNAFGEQHPDRQRQYPIVALGSVWARPRGDRDVGYLWGGADRRDLDLRWPGLDWLARCRFLAVRK
jgi:hypothetical protein